MFNQTLIITVFKELIMLPHIKKWTAHMKTGGQLRSVFKSLLNKPYQRFFLEGGKFACSMG